MERKETSMIKGAKTSSEVGLAENAKDIQFQCGTCEYFGVGLCHNPNPKLFNRKVEKIWCCNLYDHKGMKVIV